MSPPSLVAITPPRPNVGSRIRTWWGPLPLTQLSVIAAVIGLLWWFGINTVETMSKAGINPGFDFLRRAANFEIGEAVISYSSADPYARAILVGLLNTVKVALLGCVLATMLGVTLGVLRLAGNPLLAGLIRWYVEIIRNTPLLLQLFFWSALTKALPPPRQAISLVDSAFLSNRGIFVPGLVQTGGNSLVWPVTAIVLTAAIAAIILLRKRARWVTPGALLLSAGLIGAAFLLSGTTLAYEVPAMGSFNIRGGYSLSPEFAALLIGLTVKFSAAIAEIVRAGIESVDRGQWEAARALGLHNGQIMHHIVLPQALCVITPLITSSFLDLTKDSSLAVAIGYPDLVNVINTTSNTTGQALEALAILVGVYLTLNLSVSALMNQYNRRVALRGMGLRR